jgi:hypothetical protein
VPYLVDGDNLLGTWPDRRRTSAERRRLAHEIARWATRAGKRVVVVFDGADDNLARLGPDVRCAGGGTSADDLILAILRTEPDRAGWTVVTSDRPLGDRARWLGAKAERSDVFRKRLLASGDTEKPEREPNVREWLERFGEDVER